MVFAAISALFGPGTHVQHTSIGTAVAGDVAVIFLVALPTFIAGRRLGNDRKLTLLPEPLRRYARGGKRWFQRVAERI
jgi:hypothetical protein